MHDRQLSTCLIAFTLGLSFFATGMAQVPSPNVAVQPTNRAAPCDCCEPHLEQVGCSDPDCESAVCAELPVCCLFPWSATCAEKAAQICECCEDCNDNGIPDPDDTAVQFQTHLFTWNNSTSNSLFPTDLDGDGDLDLLHGSPVVWRENLDGSATFGAEQAIGGGGKSVTAGDLNGDGYNDVVKISGSVVWYENLDGLGSFGTGTVLPCPYIQGSRVQIHDLDNDGDNDLFLRWSSTLLWFQNLDGLGTFEECESLASHSSLEVANLADLDGDGDLDIFAGGDQVVWFEHLDGLGSFGPVRIIAPNCQLAEDVWASDLDGDQDNDVLLVSLNGPVSWFENQGTGVWPEHAIATPPGNSRGVRTADLDNDGDPDVVVATTPQAIYWFENEDGGGSFAPARTIPVEAFFAGPADLDGDGDQDLVAHLKSSGYFHWIENLRDDCNDNHVPDECEAPDVALACVDKDHDGKNALDDCDDASPWCGDDCTDVDQDRFCPPWDCDDTNLHCTTLCVDDDDDGYCVTSDCDDAQPDCNTECIDNDGDGWHACGEDCDDDAFSCGAVDCEQDCDANNYPDACDVEVHFEPEIIGEGHGSPVVADIDRDGDNDAVLGDKMFRNLDGLGNFSPFQPIPGGTFDVADVDLDGDGDLIGRSGYTLHWSENTDGAGESFGPNQSIETLSVCEACSCCYYNRIRLGDLDGDGDPDVIRNMKHSAGLIGDVTWFENRVREGLSWVARVTLDGLILEGGVVVDVDGDQDNDLLYRSIDCDYYRTQWLENADGLGNFGTTHTIDEFPNYDSCGAFVSWEPVLAPDLDGDGDLDVVAMGSWYENLDGMGTFGPAQWTFEEGDPESFADVDGDGDIDLVARYHWYENLDGAGTFSQAYPNGVVDVGFRIQAAILDGDGDVDLIASSYDDVLVFYDNRRADCNQNTIPDGCEDPGVELGCTDVDLDGFTVFNDCDDGNPFCTVDCTDADGDGFCVEADCDDMNPGCTLSCLDFDADGYCAGRDCALRDPTTYPGAEEINDGDDNQCPGFPGHGLIDEISGDAGFHDLEDKNRYSWESQGGATNYEVGRAESADFTVNCTSFAVDTNALVDENEPASGATFYYLVRPTAPNVGSWGADSGNVERVVPCSP